MRLSFKYLSDIMDGCCRWSTLRVLWLLVSGAVGLGSVTGISNAHAAIPRPEGWRLQFGDDFNGAANTLPSRARWRLDTGHRYPSGPPQWGTGEIQTYTANKANVSLDGQGHLRITPLRDKSGHWTSARIETRQGNFRPPVHGVLRIEARIQMPYVADQAAQGYWPAFWALGQSYRKDGLWPKAGEFDIMENVNGINSVWGILHCGVYPGGPCGEPDGLGRRASCDDTTCQAAFHVYTFEWDRSISPMQIRWYVDGKLYDHVSQNQLPAATWNEITGQGGYFLLLNVAMGGGFSYAMAGGVPTPNEKTEPGHPMLVDYVAVWTKASADKH
ncbi:glycoside hydrolase family 16 protein [Rhodanobacter sp. BL-MT-08]